jgi:phosphoglycerol transferase MdoB-like AlkP superfamily enzyme
MTLRLLTVAVERTTRRDLRVTGAGQLFWAALMLAVTLVAIKAYHLGVPVRDGLPDYLRLLSAISYVDVLFAAACWAAGRVVLVIAWRRPLAARAVSGAFVVFAALGCFYAVVNIILFGIVGGFLTYPLLSLIGDVRMVGSSVSAHMTLPTIAGLILIPSVYVASVAALTRLMRAASAARWGRASAAILAAWVAAGHYTYVTKFDTLPSRRVAESPYWAIAASTWQAFADGGFVRMPGTFTPDDLEDFDPLNVRQAQMASLPRAIRRATATLDMRAIAARRPPNVVLIVLESVAARWTSLHNPLYATTPTLQAESARSAVADNFYAHTGRSSNSLVAMLLSAYPKLDFRDLTVQYPDFPGTSLATMFRSQGYRTTIVTPSDMEWAGWRGFLEGHGFEDVLDYRDLACPKMVSSWGVEDRCMVDKVVDLIAAAGTRPFFVTGWTTQTHHPYEPSPGVPSLNLLRESTPDTWEVGRYLNVVHETDRHLARIFEAVRRAGLEQDTLIVVTGDHGQAFGYPHDTYTQGRTVYEEDVHVPLMMWYPRKYKATARVPVVGGHVDLAPTITELIGLPAATDWQGRSLFDQSHPRRAYFYVAEDHFRLAVREGNWKYIYNVRDGRDELYDLQADPLEQRNVAAQHPDRCDRLRQRLAAWTEANRRQYERVEARQHP